MPPPSEDSNAPYPDRRTYANSALRIDIHAELPCFHDWIGWYLDVGDRVDSAEDPLSLTFRIAAGPPAEPAPLPPGTMRLSHSRVDPVRKCVWSWPTARAGRRVPMEDGASFFLDPLFSLLESLGWHPVHAAIVTKDGHRVAFVGDGHAGKSSLAVLLAMFGWTLYGDDMAFLRVHGGRIELLPLPRRVKFRSRHLATFLNQRQLVTPSPADPADLDHQNPLTLVFPRYREAAGARFRGLTQSETTSRVLDCNLRQQGARAEHFQTLCTLGSSARGFDLEYDDTRLDELAHAIEHRVFHA